MREVSSFFHRNVSSSNDDKGFVAENRQCTITNGTSANSSHPIFCDSRFIKFFGCSTGSNNQAMRKIVLSPCSDFEWFYA